MLPLVDANWNPSCLNITGDYHVLRAVAVQHGLPLNDAVNQHAHLLTHAQTPGLGGLPQGIVVSCNFFDHDAPSQLAELLQLDRVKGVSVRLEHSHVSQVGVLQTCLDHIAERQLSIDISGDIKMLTHLNTLMKNYAIPLVCNLSTCTRDDVILNQSDWAAIAQAISDNPYVFIKLTNALLFESACEHSVDLAEQAADQSQNLTPVLHALVDCVGMHRILFGSAYQALNSEWVSANWRCFDLATQWVSATDRDSIFRRNAVQLYQL